MLGYSSTPSDKQELKSDIFKVNYRYYNSIIIITNFESFSQNYGVITFF
jgi:hypothetical protein